MEAILDGLIASIATLQCVLTLWGEADFQEQTSKLLVNKTRVWVTW